MQQELDHFFNVVKAQPEFGSYWPGRCEHLSLTQEAFNEAPLNSLQRRSKPAAVVT